MAKMPLDKPPVLDDLIEDVKSQTVKNKVMARMRSSSLFNSISKVAMYVGTLLTTAGAGMALPGLIAGTGVATATLGILAIGAAVIGAAVATDYIASRIYQSCQFDNLEANADSTARHLVKELKTNNMCMTTEHSCDAETELKNTWAKEYMENKQAQQAAVSQRA